MCQGAPRSPPRSESQRSCGPQWRVKCHVSRWALDTLKADPRAPGGSGSLSQGCGIGRRGKLLPGSPPLRHGIATLLETLQGVRVPVPVLYTAQDVVRLTWSLVSCVCMCCSSLERSSYNISFFFFNCYCCFLLPLGEIVYLPLVP